MLNLRIPRMWMMQRATNKKYSSFDRALLNMWFSMSTVLVFGVLPDVMIDSFLGKSNDNKTFQRQFKDFLTFCSQLFAETVGNAM